MDYRYHSHLFYPYFYTIFNNNILYSLKVGEPWFPLRPPPPPPPPPPYKKYYNKY